jgi:uncharacterized protein
MNIPIKGDAALYLAAVLGMVFGLLLHRGGVTTYNVIVNQFRFKDFTVLKIMFTAIIVGGIGVLVLHNMHHANYHIKPANMLGVVLGASIFGAGMAIYGYCPGTGVAAIATGSFHALFGFVGMLVGGMLYAFSFTWVRDHILNVWSLGKLRLPEITRLGGWQWFAILIGVAAVVFTLIELLGP